jgi:cytochrome c-type biogenesis protein CcmH/NrfG
MSSINEALRRSNRTVGVPVSHSGRYPGGGRFGNWMAWALAIVAAGLLAFSGGAVAWKLRADGPSSAAGRDASSVATATATPVTGAEPEAQGSGDPAPPEPTQAEPQSPAATETSVLTSPEDQTESEPVESGAEDDEALADGQTLLPADDEVIVARAAPEKPAAPLTKPTVLTEAMPTRPGLLPLPGQEQPGESEARQAQELFQSARAAQEDGRNEEAVSGYRRAILSDPGLTEAYLNLGNLLFYHVGDADGAEAMYSQVLRLDPENKLAHNNLGVIRLGKGLLAEAEASLSTALKLDPRYVDAIYNLACLTARQGRADLAISYLQKVGRLNPEAMGWAAKDHDFDGLRDNPEFVNFVAGNH